MGGILLAKLLRGGAASLCSENLSVDAAVEEDEEAKAVANQNVALTPPCVPGFAGRVIEPIAGEGEVPTQCGQCGVARVEVTVESKVLRGRRRLCGG